MSKPNIYTIAGWAIIITIFAAMFGSYAYAGGLKFAALVFAISAGGAALVFLAAWLLVRGENHG